MPSAGLSLVGFMDEAQAIQHLSGSCVPANPDPNVLKAEWLAAKAKLGAPIANAGRPAIMQMPASAATHLQQLAAAPWAQPLVAGVSFELVEIEPLLAFQFTIDKARSTHHCAGLSAPPTIYELLALALPLTQPQEQYQAIHGHRSAILKAKSLNVRALAQGLFTTGFMGIQFGVGSPLVHVVRHNGRCYLHNGFHRAFGASMAGATHIPCVFRDVPDHAAVGICAGATFDAQLLESADPPTLAHFTKGRAHDVNLRSVSRFLHVSWEEYAIPDE